MRESEDLRFRERYGNFGESIETAHKKRRVHRAYHQSHAVGGVLQTAAVNRTLGGERAYFKEMKTVFADLYESCGGELPEGLFTESQKGDRCLVVIAGDRGLAGGYNNNVFSLSSSVMAEEKGKDGNSASGPRSPMSIIKSGIPS